MSQIRDKKGRKKGIETKNPINAKSVQLIELHAFACDLVCIYLSESFDFLKIGVLYVLVSLAVVLSLLAATGVVAVEALACVRLCTACILIHLCAGCLHYGVEAVDGVVDGCDVTALVCIAELVECVLDVALLVSRNLVAVVFQEVFGSEDH